MTTDWSMPVMGGLEFLKLLRAYLGGERPRIVFCVTENDIGQIALAMKSGTDDYMMKPFDRDLLEAKFAPVAALIAEHDGGLAIRSAQQVLCEVQPGPGEPHRIQHALAVLERGPRPAFAGNAAEFPERVPERAGLRRYR